MTWLIIGLALWITPALLLALALAWAILRQSKKRAVVTEPKETSQEEQSPTRLTDLAPEAAE